MVREGGGRKKKDIWKSVRVGTADAGSACSEWAVPDASWDDSEVCAWLQWWRPVDELKTLCTCIGVLKSTGDDRCDATAMRAALRDYYQTPVQGAPDLAAVVACSSAPQPQPEPEPNPLLEADSCGPGSDAKGPVMFGVLPYDCMIAVLDAGLEAVDLARLALAVPALFRLLQGVAEDRLTRHELRAKTPPRRPPPSLSIWHAEPTVAQRDFSGNELASGHWTGGRLRSSLHILWELEGLAAPLCMLPTPGSALISAESGALVSRPMKHGESGPGDGAADHTDTVPPGVSAVCFRSVMRSGVHFAEFNIVRMDEMDSGLGVRVGICRRGCFKMLDEVAGTPARRSSHVRGAPASVVAGACVRDKPSATSGTDEYLRYLEWSRSNLAAASVFSTEYAWGFEARTGSLVHRGKRAWWRTKGVAPGVDICRCVPSVCVASKV